MSAPTLTDTFGRAPALVRPLPAGGWAYTQHVLGAPAADAPTLPVVYAVVMQAAQFERLPATIVEAMLDGADNTGLLGLFDLLVAEGRGAGGFDRDTVADVRDRIAGLAA